jgi:broad specificity phosphatase PhoE
MVEPHAEHTKLPTRPHPAGRAAILTLARHGQTLDNAEGRWEGRRDGPLTPEGRRQVEALGHRLKPLGPYAVVYVSPLGRAVETAQLLLIVLGELPVRTDVRLAEYDFGAWDGLTPAELRARGFWDAVQRDPEFAPPLGEPFGAAARRVATALQEVAARHPGARVVVVGHGLTLAAALALLLDGDPRHAPRYALGNAGMAELTLDSSPRLIHLDPVIS